MNGTAARFFRLGVSLSGLVVLGWVLTGQAAKPARRGIPLATDWSHSHLIFSRPGTAEQLARVSQDPRYEQQIYRREQATMLPAGMVDLNVAPTFRGKKSTGLWSVDLGSGGSVGAGNYPARFAASRTTASCSADFVVFSTGLLGSVNQASIVGFNDLYSGCGGTVPSVNWAYNTAGQVLTSPLISRDGTQIAFVQTNVGQVGTLVLIRWAASTGTIGIPATPTMKIPAQYLGCTAPCMTTVILHDGSNLVTDDTTSSVFYDYTNDIAWVGGARGWLHKITGVFNGTPTEVHGGGFPVQVSPPSTNPLSSPVYDGVSTNVFVGDGGGFLYSVNSTTGAVTPSAQLDFGTGLLEGPIVNSTYGLVYVFASSDGSTNCPAAVFTEACSAVYQLPASFAAGDTGTEVIVGNSVVFGTLPNPSPLFIGAFDGAYYNSLNATGNLYVCGNTGANATLYQIPISAGVMPVSGLGLAVTALAKSASTAPCSPVADVPNPNTTGGSSERIFVSVQNDGTATACGSAGCIFNFVSAPWKASTAYAVGQQLLSGNLHVETVITSGTSGSSVPSWSNSAGGKKTDGGVTWIDQGALTATTIAGWVAGHHYSVATSRILDTNFNVQVSTTPGIAGSGVPTWNTTPGGTTADGTVTWTNVGTVGTFALSAAGGTSGIIIDNILNGTLAGTSQVYFSTLSDQVCGTSGTGGCAVQASQPGLN